MNPFAIIAGILGPQLLGKLFGGGGGQEDLRKQIMALLSPQALEGRTNAIQSAWYRSPAFGAAQEASLAAGRQAESAVSRAGAGVTSGMDVLRSAGAAGVGSGTLAGLNAAAYNQSRDIAQRQAETAAGANLSIGARPDISREMLGASLNFLGPLFASWLTKRMGVPSTSNADAYKMGSSGWNYPLGGR